MKNFSITHVKKEARVELHDTLALTGSEISINTLPAGVSVPFVHAHKKNEEVYGILSGHGYAMLDGERIELEEGSWLRVAPETDRQFGVASDSALTYICIQTKTGSLEGFTQNDAIIK